MSVQTKKVSKKNKVSPNDTELEAQFYVAQRAKSSRVTKGPKLSQSSNGNYESQEPILGFSKESIPYIDKQIFLQDSFEEIKEMNTIPSGPTMEVDEGAIQDLPKNNEGNEEKEASNDILRIFDNQYMPSKHLFREKESKEILDFIIRCIKKRNYKSLLVSGPPGTGKTIVLTHLLEKLKEYGLNDVDLAGEDEKELISDTYERINVLNVNAAYCESLSPILLEVIKLINNKIPASVSEYKTNSKVLVDKLRQIILTKKPKNLNVIVIDEIDSLLIKQNAAKEVAELLKIPNYPFSNIIFIVVTNIVDLVPKLYEQHKVNIEIDQVSFEPYSIQEMITIFKHRLKSVEKPLSESPQKNILDKIDWESCIQEMKSLKDTDVRHVFRIIRRAYANQKQPELQTGESQSPICLDEPQFTEQNIIQAYKELYDENLSSSFSSMSQKHLMCLAAIVALSEKKNSLTVIKKDILTVYNNSCARLFFPKSDLNNLTEMLSLFEAYNLVEVKPKEAKETENSATKEVVQKTPAKNANEEYNIKIPIEKIKNTLRQDGYFAKSFPE